MLSIIVAVLFAIRTSWKTEVDAMNFSEHVFNTFVVFSTVHL